MSDDLISRQAAIDFIAAGLIGNPKEPRWSDLEVVNFLKSRPSAQRTGRWIRHPEQKNIYGGKCVECSECGEKYVVQYIEYEKFCRNCGARMEVEE